MIARGKPKLVELYYIYAISIHLPFSAGLTAFGRQVTLQQDSVLPSNSLPGRHASVPEFDIHVEGQRSPLAGPIKRLNAVQKPIWEYQQFAGFRFHILLG